MFFRKLNWDIVGQRNIWFALSGAVIVAGIIALFVHHGLKLGLSFTGGTTIDIKFNTPVTETGIRQALGAIDLSNVNPQDKAQYQALVANQEGIQLASKPEDKQPDERAVISLQGTVPDATPVYQALDKAGMSVDRLQSSVTAVGPSLSQEYLNKSLWALVIALVLQLLYIAFRFGNQLRYGVIADLALIHDVLVMVGIYAIANRPADDAFLAALLTVIGYSVMDSIVIFDRIRENGKIMTDVPYDKMVNTSLLQTMTRSVNTLATVLITLFALYFFGGDTLKNFAFALIVGVTSGAYSSIFIASPLLVLWKNQNDRSRTAKRAAVAAASSQPARSGGGASNAPAAPMRKIPPKVKRQSAPAPRYRRKRDDAGVETPTDGASVGVLTDPDDAADAPIDDGPPAES
ncbi:MAG TPA: protein translocase subunit SecF [Candidatus Eremiobacteraceae bacterium]|nr:protein translocase subunit SecF [Candidatus Eremiobacteraceae bacterium]